MKPLKVAIIAGEVSGDQLAAELIAALKTKLHAQTGQDIDLMGVGGPGLVSCGLEPLFDYSELSIMGISAVLAKLPKLLWRIRQTAKSIIEFKPDIFIIVDSPDFTHRVAKIVHEKTPDVPIINYVCPTVWAWKPERALKMRGYIDHILSVLPFEPEIVEELSGPAISYIGHRLMENSAVEENRNKQCKHELSSSKTILLLPGSRNSELNRNLETIKKSAVEYLKFEPDTTFILPTIARFEQRLTDELKYWPFDVELVVGEADKWDAFGQADAALAVSGTILLELAIARVPCISIYKIDLILNQHVKKLDLWSAALPNWIVNYPAVPEFYNQFAQPGALARHLYRLSNDTLQRDAMLEAFDIVHERMSVDRPPSEHGADIVIKYLK
ncbi:MAG: lipid-A-disaccharide synthase [Lentilitoribacter sp.]